MDAESSHPRSLHILLLHALQTTIQTAKNAVSENSDKEQLAILIFI